MPGLRSITTLARPGRLLALGLLVVAALPLTDAAAEPSDPAATVSLDPARILDTRTGLGAAAPGAIAPGQTVTLQVAGAGGVPADATAVVANVTVTGATGAGWVAAYPADGQLPDASVINYSSGDDVANMITAKLSPTGALNLFNAQANAHLLVDVAGFLTAGGSVVGQQGPQGPAGPQGPPGADAAPGLGFDESIAAPGDGFNEVVLGTVGTLTVRLRCTFTFVTSVEFDSAGGLVRLRGSAISYTGGTVTEVNMALGAPGTLVRATAAIQHLIATLHTPDGGFAQVDVSFGRTGGNCLATGSIVPT